MRVAALLCCLAATLAASPAAAEFTFKPEQIEAKLGVGYAVSLVDMNADKKPDILVVDTDRVMWYENPSWKMHLVIEGKTKKDNVCIAAHDIDGDGKLELVLGADWRPGDTLMSGSLQVLTQPKKEGDQWDVLPIGAEPTIHRIRWADFNGDGKPQLIVAPLFGRGSTAPKYMERATRILAYTPSPQDLKGGWKEEVISEELHVIHNIWPTDFDDDGKLDLLAASFEGVTLFRRGLRNTWTFRRIGAGNQDTSPNRGASEVKPGRLKGKEKYIATIEPWHGHQVVVYTKPADEKKAEGLWDRTVLDEDLKWGHAVWCANLDDDEEEELIIGVRDNKSDKARCGLRIYDPKWTNGKLTWERQLVDPGGVAIEDLAAADLDGDGRTDIVAVGRATKNVRIYWNGKK